APCSCATRLRMVLRLRPAASYVPMAASSARERPGSRWTTCEADRVSYPGMARESTLGRGVAGSDGAGRNSVKGEATADAADPRTVGAGDGAVAAGGVTGCGAGGGAVRSALTGGATDGLGRAGGRSVPSTPSACF